MQTAHYTYKRHALLVCEEGVGRLDRFLKKNFKTVPYGGLLSAVRKGRVRVNGKKVKWDHVLCLGDAVETSFENKKLPASAVYAVSDIEKITVFEDSHFLVCNKPKGLAVHQGTKNVKTLDGMLRFYSQAKGGAPVRLGHRLDKDTSGLLVCPKSRQAADELRLLLTEKRVSKYYIAILNGWVCQKSGTIAQPLNIEGRRVDALSRYQKLAGNKQYTLVALQAVTGRKRQLRTHCAALKHPIVGDYGCALRGKEPLMLHAYHLQMQAFDQQYRWTCPLPSSMLSFLKQHITRDTRIVQAEVVW